MFSSAFLFLFFVTSRFLSVEGITYCGNVTISGEILCNGSNRGGAVLKYVYKLPYSKDPKQVVSTQLTVVTQGYGNNLDSYSWYLRSGPNAPDYCNSTGSGCQCCEYGCKTIDICRAEGYGSNGYSDQAIYTDSVTIWLENFSPKEKCPYNAPPISMSVNLVGLNGYGDGTCVDPLHFLQR